MVDRHFGNESSRVGDSTSFRFAGITESGTPTRSNMADDEMPV